MKLKFRTQIAKKKNLCTHIINKWKRIFWSLIEQFTSSLIARQGIEHDYHMVKHM